MSMKIIENRFWRFVDKNGPIMRDGLDECWTWLSKVSNSGYGVFAPGISAHRVGYEIQITDIPDGLYVCHLCDNKLCVRGSHLYLGTPGENTRDAIKRGLITGESHTKLTSEQVAYIRSVWPDKSTRELAKELDVTQGNIASILKNRTRYDPNYIYKGREAAKKPDTRGEKSGVNKLSEEEAIYVANSDESTSVLAKQFNVHITTIKAIRKGLTWKHISVERMHRTAERIVHSGDDHPRRINPEKWANQSHGSDHHMAKLTDDVVRQILNDTEHNQRELAELYGVNRSVIGKITRREIWKHVN